MTFADWYKEITGLSYSPEVKTECLSIYSTTHDGMVLQHREFCVPHNAPESFVQSVASLYDNVARCVFGRENTHGQLMALAAFADVKSEESDILSKSSIVQISPDDRVTFRNDWQHAVEWGAAPEQYSFLAHVCQLATEDALMAYARKAREISQSRNLAVAGGVFLNILANTRIAESGIFDQYFVPSAPHDAGISVGCAFYGDRFTTGSRHCTSSQPALDRLGFGYGNSVVEAELFRSRHVLRYFHTSMAEVASMLAKGALIARWSGRAEFGPRALGGRSILGSPLLTQTKERLNQIKGRQKWRPVAPIIIHERLEEFFIGPNNSPYMTFAHQVRSEYVDALVALSHADRSTRAQTHLKEVDEDLYQLLMEFDALTGYPILVNTSMNGAGEPIIETPREALEFFTAHDDIDALLMESWLVFRRGNWEEEELKKRRIRLADGCIISLIFPNGVKKALVTRGALSFEISLATLELLCSLGEGKIVQDILKTHCETTSATDVELYNLLLQGIVSLVDE